VLCVGGREDSCLCHVSSTLVGEFEDDLTAISSCSDENDLSKLSRYLTAGRGRVILLLLNVVGLTVCLLCQHCSKEAADSLR